MDAIEKAVRRLDKEATGCDYKGNAWLRVIPARQILRELVADAQRDALRAVKAADARKMSANNWWMDGFIDCVALELGLGELGTPEETER